MKRRRSTNTAAIAAATCISSLRSRCGANCWRAPRQMTNAARRATISASRSRGSASGRAGRRGSRRRCGPIARRWRSRPASAFRSTGRRTQNNLGNALVRLGERESGTARLEEAVAAYRAALEERTRERVPRYWAQTQRASALRSQGSASGRAARRGSMRRFRPIARPWRRGPASAFRSTGRRRRTISAMRSECSASGRAGRRTRRGGRGLSRGAGGKDARAGSARLGEDAEQSRQCAPKARRAGERHGAAR